MTIKDFNGLLLAEKELCLLEAKKIHELQGELLKMEFYILGKLNLKAVTYRDDYFPKTIHAF